MSTREYHLVYATDPNYVLPLRVAAVSAAHHCPRDPDTQVTIWVLHERVPIGEQKRLAAKVVQANPRVVVQFLDCANTENFPDQIEDHRTHLSRAALFRLLIPQLLPASVKRVVYMDCDLVVLRDLSPLFETDLEGWVFGAVQDWMFPTVGDRWKNEGDLAAVCDGPSVDYINTGVMLIDTVAWRGEGDLAGRVINTIREHPAETRMKDQDGLNIVMNRRFRVLPGKWNGQTATFGSVNPDTVAQGKALAEAAGLGSPADAAVIHFTVGKPWYRGFRDPYAPIWWRFVKSHRVLSGNEILHLKVGRTRYMLSCAIRSLCRRFKS